MQKKLKNQNELSQKNTNNSNINNDLIITCKNPKEKLNNNIMKSINKKENN